MSSADDVDGTFKGKVSPRLITPFSFITPTLIVTISSSTFLFLCPACALRAKNVFRSDSFWDLNVWKLGRENGVVVVSQRPVGNVLTFTPHLGQNLNSFSKQNPHLEQNEHGPSEAMFDALVRFVKMARKWCIKGLWDHSGQGRFTLVQRTR